MHCGSATYARARWADMLDKRRCCNKSLPLLPASWLSLSFALREGRQNGTLYRLGTPKQGGGGLPQINLPLHYPTRWSPSCAVVYYPASTARGWANLCPLPGCPLQRLLRDFFGGWPKAAAKGPKNMSVANPDVAETRAELRAVSKKLSSCEAALEGQSAYLGIRDPVRERVLLCGTCMPNRFADSCGMPGGGGIFVYHVPQTRKDDASGTGGGRRAYHWVVSGRPLRPSN